MVFISILMIIFLVVGILCAWWYIEFFKYRKYLWKFPGPRTFPIIGSAYCFGIGKGLLPSLMNQQAKYGEVVNFMFGYTPRLILSGSKSVQFLLGSNSILEKSFEYGFFHSWLGLGLLTSSGSRWKQHRKLLTPAFHFQILERFIEVFETQTNILLKKLEDVDKEEVNIFPYIKLYALDVICEATMNTSVNAQHNSDSDYVCSVNEMCKIISIRNFSSIKMWDFLYKFSKDYQKEKKAIDILHGYTKSVISKRRKELLVEIQNSSMPDKIDVGVKKILPLLDILLQCTVNGNPLSNDDIREEVDTFMFEGHDTITSGISFILYSLSKNPDVQDKVIEELQCICTHDKPLAYDDLQQMKYLEQVIKESLRLYPPVPIFARILTEDVNFDGNVLPKNAVLIAFAFGLHRQPELFPNPEVFDPERFNLENSKNRSIYSYIPFSAGPRNCIGQRFAMLEMKYAVSSILTKFQLLPVIGHEPALLADIVLQSENGLPIRLRKRHIL